MLSNIHQQSQQINRSEYGSKVLYKLVKVYDFIGHDEVKLRDPKEQYKKKQRPKQEFHKKRQPKGQKFRNVDYGIPSFDPRVSQKGLVNMNMNYINLNLNVNYQNQQNSKKSG